MDRGEALFAADSPFGAFVRRERLPCCTMTALWLAALSGVAIDLSGRQRAIDSAPRGMGAAWWGRANVWDARHPWSALDAYPAGVTGADVAYQPPRLVSAAQPAPVLTPGRWTLIQRWPGPRLTGRPGHAYLVRADADGAGCTVYQSSEGKGFRATPGTWDGTAGLTGWEVGAATLPSLGAA